MWFRPRNRSYYHNETFRWIKRSSSFVNILWILRDKEFISFCGGIPSPDAVDNSLGYKFSWSPIGALNALRNSAKYLKDSMEMVVPSESVLYVA